MKNIADRDTSLGRATMPARLLAVLIILALAAGCAPGYYETPAAAPQQESTAYWYKNAETEAEYRRRIEWENFETNLPRFHRFWR
jgi:hypothetical protein